MEKLLDRAFNALKSLPEADQERIAWEIIQRVEDKAEWDRLVSSPTSQKWLEKEANKALREYDKVANKLSLTFLSLPTENLLRKDAYWRHFDDLPADIKVLAEENYGLWKQNPQHPGLRFKQIHASLPIFSFRVGMRHRTVGVETKDEKIVWFWVGSFEDYGSQIS